MSLRVIGYRDGRHIVVEEGPARGRVQGAGGVSLGYFFGTLVQGDPGPVERQRQAEREFKARQRG